MSHHPRGLRVLAFGVPGPVPTKKNTRMLAVRGGRIINRPNEQCQQWASWFMLQARAARSRHWPRGQWEPIAGPFTVTIGVSSKKPAKPRRLKPGELPRPKRSDIDGAASSVLDALQSSGIVEDDYWCLSVVIEYLGESEHGGVHVVVRERCPEVYRLGMLEGARLIAPLEES